MDRRRSDFERFVGEVQPRVRHALVAGEGAQVVGLCAVAQEAAQVLWYGTISPTSCFHSCLVRSRPTI